MVVFFQVEAEKPWAGVVPQCQAAKVFRGRVSGRVMEEPAEQPQPLPVLHPPFQKPRQCRDVHAGVCVAYVHFCHIKPFARLRPLCYPLESGMCAVLADSFFSFAVLECSGGKAAIDPLVKAVHHDFFEGFYQHVVQYLLRAKPGLFDFPLLPLCPVRYGVPVVLARHIARVFGAADNRVIGFVEFPECVQYLAAAGFPFRRIKGAFCDCFRRHHPLEKMSVGFHFFMPCRRFVPPCGLLPRPLVG